MSFFRLTIKEGVCKLEGVRHVQRKENQMSESLNAEIVEGVLMVRLTDFVRSSYGSENVKRIGSTQLHKEALKLPGLKKVKGVLMAPAMEAAELLAEHGDLPGATRTLMILIEGEKEQAQQEVERERKRKEKEAQEREIKLALSNAKKDLESIRSRVKQNLAEEEAIDEYQEMMTEEMEAWNV